MNTFSESCLIGKKILVTGASSGLGSAVAIAISNCGGKVVLGGRNIDRIDSVKKSLKNPDFHSYSCFELHDADSTSDWVEEVSKIHGPLDGVFHSAGVEMIRPIRMLKQAQIDMAFAASLHSAFGIARAASRKNVVADGGSIVFMSSVAALRGQQGLSAYAAAKAGIDGMVRALVKEFSDKKIRINSIAAGAVKTPMHTRIVDRGGADVESAYEKSHPLGLGQPSDVANAVIFLLSNASQWITGTSLVVDGGYAS